MNPKLELLKRFFKNRYSRREYLELKKMLLERDPELESLMQQHWNEFSPGAGQTKDLTKVFSTIYLEPDKKSTGFNSRKLLRGWSRVAAVLLLPLLLISAFLYLKVQEYYSQKDVYVEITSPAGSRTSMNLPDGSKVWMNGNSSISYPVSFNQHRQVKLKGEAFFRVSSDRKHPFLVQAGDLTIKATGTEFNVQAYPDEAGMSVILKEGNVSVLDAKQSVLQEMKADHRYHFDRHTSGSEYTQIKAQHYTDWINGRLVFENATMREVIKRMEHWYGVQIEVRDSTLLDLHFKATFINESIDEALKLLQATATFRYRFSSREIRADGSHAEAKIIINNE